MRRMTTFCGACGEPVDAAHPDCERLLAFDPPRFCATCGFRLDVQVYPGGVTSRCRRCSRTS
jgi:hypothetical protein